MTETNYEYIIHDGKKIQVDSAIRDGDGYRISTTYPKKVDIRAKPGNKKILKVIHGLDNAPSAVSLYQVHKHLNPSYPDTSDEQYTESFEMIGADISVTDIDITITFKELPPVDPVSGELELLVRSLI